MHKFQIHIDSARNIGVDEIHDALCASYGSQKVNVYRVMEDGSLRAYKEPPVGDPRPRQTKKILSEEWVDKLAEYWCDGDRMENLGHFIQRVAEATEQELNSPPLKRHDSENDVTYIPEIDKTSRPSRKEG